MNCTKCGGSTATPDTRKVEGGTRVVRIRKCLSKRCGWQFPTEERALRSAPDDDEPRAPYPRA